MAAAVHGKQWILDIDEDYASPHWGPTVQLVIAAHAAELHDWREAGMLGVVLWSLIKTMMAIQPSSVGAEQGLDR